jgi:putative ABC transport system permease protein
MGRSRSLLWHLLARVSFAHWREHGLRTALTVVGVSLGVATVIAVSDVSETVLRSFQQTIATVAGASDLEITSPTGSVQEELIEKAASVPGVQAAAGVVEGFVPLVEDPQRSLYVLGIDFLGSPIWQAQVPRRAIEIPDELAFGSHVDSVMITRRFAARAHLALGDELRVLTPGGPRSLRVRGMIEDAPVTLLFDGMIAIMDLPAAEILFDQEGLVGRIGLELAPGANIEEVRPRVASALGAAVELAAPESRGAQAEKLLFSLRSMLLTASSLAVIVGALLVYQTVAVSVQQRSRQFALLHTIGVRRRVLVLLCLTETLALALLGAGAGLVAGRRLASLGSGLVAGTASEIWLRVGARRAIDSYEGGAVAALVGIVTALVAAWLAARATFRTTSVEALRATSVESTEGAGGVRPIALAVSLLGATWLLALVPPGVGFAAVVTLIIATQAIAYAGAAVLGPSLVSLVGSLARRAARPFGALPVLLAAENLPRTPRRSGTTVATIAAAVGMAVTVAGLVRSFDSAWLGWLDEHFGADLFVGSGGRFRLLAEQPMALQLGATLAEVPGVASVEPFRVRQVRAGDRPIFLQGISLDDRLAHGGLLMVEGDFARAVPGLRDGSAVLLSENLATRLALHRGDDIDLPTPAGPRRFRVGGVYVDYLGSLDLGAVALANTQLAEIWNDRMANLFRIWLEPGASVAEVRSRLLEHLGRGYYVLGGREFLDSVRAVLDRFFLATWALEVVAAVVGVIGILNAQLATVLDRSREIATLRTIGVRRRDVARTIVVECGTLGVVGAAAGVALGLMLGAQFVSFSLRLVTGWRIPFVAPWAAAAASLVIAMLVSASAAYLPASVAAGVAARQESVD